MISRRHQVPPITEEWRSSVITSLRDKGSNEGQQPSLDERCCLARRQMMEPLWSPAVATGGKRWQIAQPPKRQNHAKTVAMACNQLPRAAHGKEGVRGSSPREGFTNPLLLLTSFFGRLLRRQKRGAACTERPRLAARAARDGSKPAC